MKQVMITLVVVLASAMSNAQASPALSVSDKYPLMAHIKQVQMEEQQRTANGTGHTHIWRLMIAEINGRTYGLDAKNRDHWLDIGDSPCGAGPVNLRQLLSPHVARLFLRLGNFF